MISSGKPNSLAAGGRERVLRVARPTDFRTYHGARADCNRKRVAGHKFVQGAFERPRAISICAL